MGLRKAGAYTTKYARPYTRKSTKKSKSYIKTIPVSKIVKFHMGDIKSYKDGKFRFVIELRATEDAQVRDNALEAARQFMNKALDEQLQGVYYFKIGVYPHHILRENAMIAGAGADRMQTGMQLSFGKTMGRAAMVKEGKDVLLVATDSDKKAGIARHILNQIKSKISCRSRVVTTILK